MSHPITPWQRSGNRVASFTKTLMTPRLSSETRALLTRRAGTLVKYALVIAFAVFCSHMTAMAQNAGTAPVFGQAVQGEQATTVEGTVLNVVNFICNVLAFLVAPVCFLAAIWSAREGRGWMGWGISGFGLMMTSAIVRLAERHIQTAGAV